MTLAKRSAAAFGCQKYRSILLSSVAGKLFHRGVRNRLAPTFLRTCSDLHGGVRSGIGVDTISISVKCFQAMCHAQHVLPALVFYDVRAAYYQVLRETLTGGPMCDKVLLSFFHRLGVPPEAYTAELKQQLEQLAVLVEQDFSPHAVELTKELFTGTWFRMDFYAPLALTEAGVRPGDPLADLFFALSFSAYVRSVQTALEAHDLATALPVCRTTPHWISAAPPPTLEPASWADDFVALHAAPEVDSLVSRVQAATEVYLTHATSNGIQLAFAVDKTAAVLPPQAVRAPHPAFVQSDDVKCIVIRDGITQQLHHLPIVPAYKHLGSVVTSAGTVVPEIHYRFAQATWTLKPLRGVLFGNPSVPLATRRHLLQSLVVSKFTFGSATIELHVAGHWRLWARLYTSLFRALRPRSKACHTSIIPMRRCFMPTPARRPLHSLRPEVHSF